MEYQSSPGDSGTGVFAYLDGQSKLVGINSFTYGDYNYGSASGISRLSYFNSWVDQIQVSYVPEPASCSILALGLFALALNRRRQAA